MSAPSPRLEIRNLRRAFNGRAVVDDVSLSIHPGEVICLLGPSGCGKSTTLRMIAGVEMQDKGEIYVDGNLICDTVYRVPPERREIGLMFQDFALFPHLSVAENVAFGLKSLSRDQKRARVEELLERVDLKRFMDGYPHQLSGGEQQRVALARALAPKPKIMLMDEPFSGLDNRLRDGIRDDTLTILKEQDTAVLLVTHEPDEAMRMADEIALMRDGRIVQMGAPYSVYTRPEDQAAVAFFSDVNVLRATVQDALVDTPFGPFLAPGHAEGTVVEIVFRPQHLRIDFDRAGEGPKPTKTDGTAARAQVVRARFMGNESLVEFRLDHDGAIL
ncbi:MAG: ABC transporter ATP-binding protein, partial [Pseudomonadota bacterium]